MLMLAQDSMLVIVSVIAVFGMVLLIALVWISELQYQRTMKDLKAKGQYQKQNPEQNPLLGWARRLLGWVRGMTTAQTIVLSVAVPVLATAVMFVIDFKWQTRGWGRGSYIRHRFDAAESPWAWLVAVVVVVFFELWLWKRKESGLVNEAKGDTPRDKMNREI